MTTATPATTTHAAAARLLLALRTDGISLRLDGGELRFRAPGGVLAPAWRSQIEEHRAALVALLSGTAEPELATSAELPLSDLQRAYWFGERDVGTVAGTRAHVFVELELDSVDVDRVEDVIRRLVTRHEALRSEIRAPGVQHILAEVPPFCVERVDLRGLDDATILQRLAERRERMAAEGPTAERWPPFEVAALSLDSSRVRFFVAVSLLVLDGTSFRVLAREVAQLYRDPESALAPTGLSYRSYAVAARPSPDVASRSLEYWRARLDTLPPAPELPLAEPDPARHAPRFRRYEAELPGVTWRRLCERGARAGITPAALLCAAYADVIGRWSRRPAFTLNVMHHNRKPVHRGVMDLVGNFSSTTLLAVNLAPPDGFEVRARRLQDQLWADLAHDGVGGVRVLQELNRRHGTIGRAAMPVVFSSNLEPGGRVPAVDWQQFAVGGALQTPQVWLDHQVFSRGDGVTLYWDVVEELFPDDLMAEMFAAYQAHLADLAMHEAPWTHARALPLSQDEAVRRSDANATTIAEPERVLHAAMMDRAREAPDRIAVVARDRQVTYGELSSRAASVGAWVTGQLALTPASSSEQPRRERLVAVVMDKGWEQAVAPLAILGAGAAYVPVDAWLPAERIRQVIEGSGAEAVVTQSRHDALVLAAAPSLPRLAVDLCEVGSNEPTEGSAAPSDLAYVIHTSGSTGRPKGVMIEHRAAWNTVADVNRRFGIGDSDRVLAVSSLGFDLSVWDLFGVLGAGGAVVLPDEEDLRDPERLVLRLRHGAVTVWNSVPALMQMVVTHLEARGELLPPSLRLVMLSGDWIPVSLPDRVRALAPGVEIVSLGGATEASIWSIAYPIRHVDPRWKSIPYGTPLANQSIHVLDGALAPKPDWVPGELYIGGRGVARGYLGDPERTSERFVVHPRTGERLYRTGDWGRFLPDGTVEFLGREDRQVKLRGYRIELAEIEGAFERHPSVSGAIVSIDDEGPGRRLVAMVAPHSGARPPIDELRAFLEARLPHYMIPSTIALVDELPRTANGKIDRARLRVDAAPSALVEAPALVAPRDALESDLLAAFESHLERSPLGIDDDFFQRGGDSLLAVQVAIAIEERIGRRVPLSLLIASPTVARLADALRREGADASASPLVAIQPGGTRTPFVFVHPVGGTTACYADLSRALGTDHPFFALQSVGIDGGSAPTDRIEAMAAEYLAAIRAQGLGGPLVLGGWSMGGVIACEMALQVERDGGRVKRLVLVDSPWPNEPIVTASHAFRHEFDHAISRQPAAMGGATLDERTQERLFAVLEANTQALSRYRLPRIPSSRVLLLRARGTPERPPLGPWPRDPAVETVTIEGDHDSIMRSPRAGDVARRIRTWLDDARPDAGSEGA